MPSLKDHQSNDYVKLLLLGDAKSGKTGSLVSLVKAGYKLRILDFDNLLDFFKSLVLRQCPEFVDNVEFVTLRDKTKASSTGVVIDGRPKAWIEAIKLLDRWKYDETDFGVPAEWGSDVILVVDSLSRLCDAAYDFHEAIIPMGKGGGSFDGRAIYGNAQDDVEKLLGMLTSKSFACNVIVIAHGTYMTVDNKVKLYPQGVGQKLSPKIPQYFPNYIRYSQEGEKRTIQLDSTNLISLANGNPSILHGSLDVETGLAKFFQALREPPEKKITSLSLKRIV